MYFHRTFEKPAFSIFFIKKTENPFCLQKDLQKEMNNIKLHNIALFLELHSSSHCLDDRSENEEDTKIFYLALRTLYLHPRSKGIPSFLFDLSIPLTQCECRPVCVCEDQGSPSDNLK